MRLLKFRQWNPPAKAFHYWGYVDNDDTFTSPIHGDSQQFTGLLDKQGKEIYEGDIVILSNVWTDGDKQICKAIIDGWQSIFESIEDGFYCPMGSTAQSYREVIGNICENLEFLKEAKHG